MSNQLFEQFSAVYAEIFARLAVIEQRLDMNREGTKKPAQIAITEQAI
jgi:hypothetical protein